MNKQARYYIKKAKDVVQCLLCPHQCIISPGNKGICRVRLNEEGILKAINYGYCTALALDPIEKKPLKNFLPGSVVLSVGTFGCNLKCSFCQNWQIAHQDYPNTTLMEAEELAILAQKYKEQNNIGIGYTYSEPLMWFEYVLDTAKEIKKRELKNILVSNGYIQEEPLRELLPYIDAANIDVKAFNESFYPQLCRGKLGPVRKTVEIMAQSCHVEITTLVIPGQNDDIVELEELAKWIASISPDIPLHLSRYFPNYKLDLPPTPKESLVKAKEKAAKYLKNVCLGNV